MIYCLMLNRILYHMPPQTKTIKTKDSFLVIMPAFNEEQNIEKTIFSWIPIIRDKPGSEILVIDDGSTDKTDGKLRKLAKKYEFLNVIHKKNEGHGKTLLLGYKYATKSEHPWIFQTDSDGHFSPSDSYKLWKKRNNSQFILGQRTKRKDPFYRIALSRLISLWILILFGQKIKDPNIPFRLIKRDYLKEIIEKVPKGVFAPNIFLSILAKKDGHNLHHVPVKHIPRRGGKRNHLKLLKGAFKGFVELLLFTSVTRP